MKRLIRETNGILNMIMQIEETKTKKEIKKND